MAYNYSGKEAVNCLECGKEIYGRAEKKFCCEQCKNKFNNRKTARSKKIKNRVVTALSRNYSILENLLKSGITCVEMPQMIQIGFNPGFITGEGQASGKKVRERYCFDIQYRQSPNRIFNIKRLELPVFNVRPDDSD